MTSSASSAATLDLLPVLLSAADLIARFDRRRTDATAKVDGSPVTRVDIEVDAFLRDKLGRLMPGAGWLSEETVDDPTRLSCEWIWIVDPLDGTREFLQGLPECAVSIALARRGAPVAAGVINPFTGEWGVLEPDRAPVFHGLAARPAPADLAESAAIVSRTEIRDGVVEPYRRLVRELQPVGSVAYKLLRVASGADHLTFSARPKSEWDICAGVALLQAAGRDYARFDDVPQRFNQPDPVINAGSVAGPPALVRQFLDRLADVDRPEHRAP